MCVLVFPNFKLLTEIFGVIFTHTHTLNVCLHASLGIFTTFLERLIVSVLLYVPNSPDRKLILLSLLYDIILNEI